MAERLRWWLITQLNRLPGQCWADLVRWGAYGRQRSPWSPVRPTCRFPAGRSCYCGKRRTDG